MSDDRKVKAVITALTGEFFIGQTVVVRTGTSTAFEDKQGIVKEFDPQLPLHVGIDMGEFSDGEALFFRKTDVQPL